MMTGSRSVDIFSVDNVSLQRMNQKFLKVKSGLTQRAPDWWESARFQAVGVAWSWFRQSGVVSSRPPAGNASR
jgi:hypothetical protein